MPRFLRNEIATEARHASRVVHLYDLAAAVAALRTELDGGPVAWLSPAVEELAGLLAKREQKRPEAARNASPEQALFRLIEALPLAVGLLDAAGKLRFANGSLLRLRRDRRVSPQLAIDVAASDPLAPLKAQALQGRIAEGTVRLPEGERTCRVRLAPLGPERERPHHPPHHGEGVGRDPQRVAEAQHPAESSSPTSNGALRPAPGVSVTARLGMARWRRARMRQGIADLATAVDREATARDAYGIVFTASTCLVSEGEIAVARSRFNASARDRASVTSACSSGSASFHSSTNRT